MTNPPSDISVVICAYTEARWDELMMAIRSAQNQRTKPREVIVVVDHNPVLKARISQVPEIWVVENAGARGLSNARNSGIKAAQGSIVAFLDDDAIAAPEWLERLAASYADPRVVGVGGAIVPLWSSGRPNWFPNEFDWVVGCTYRGMPESAAPVRNLIGCNMSFRRPALVSAGGFRIGRVGALSIGQEDDETEFCIRVTKHSRETILFYDPRAHVSHHVSSDRAHKRYFVSRCYSEGLSKARVSRLVGAQAGLSSERTYTLRTLPLGVLRGIYDTVHGDLGGAKRAIAIVAGLVITSAGYLVGTSRLANHRRVHALELGPLSAQDWGELERGAHRVPQS